VQEEVDEVGAAGLARAGRVVGRDENLGVRLQWAKSPASKNVGW
jgi:hypothetical protein